MTAQNLFTLLQAASDKDPGTSFFIFHESAISYGHTIDRVRRLASYLKKRGIEKGHRILINLHNGPEFIYVLFAAFQVGAVAVLTNPATGRYELKYDCDLTEPSLVFTGPAQLENFKINGSYFVDPDHIIAAGKTASLAYLYEIIESEDPLGIAADVDNSDPAVIIFTSAMDGVALGAPITHHGILESIRGGIKSFREGEDVFISVLPLFHSFGLISSLLLPLYARSRIYLMDRFSPRSVLDLLRSHSTSVFCGVPAMYALLSKLLPPGENFPFMKIWISGGEAISTTLQRQMAGEHGIEIRQGYGLTEASPIVSWNTADRPNRHGSIGIAMPYNEVKLLTQSMEFSSTGSGELLVRGSNVISEYYRRRDKTAELIRDGWLFTGDTGYIDADGYIFITGRKKNMIIRKGFNVYPLEVETILRHHPSIDDVRISGHHRLKDDSTFEETLTAQIYRKAGHTLNVASIVEWCHRNLTPYKIPDTIKIL